MYFVNLTATREQNGTERFEVMWGVGDKVRERTEDVSSFLDGTDVAKHYLDKLFSIIIIIQVISDFFRSFLLK